MKTRQLATILLALLATASLASGQDDTEKNAEYLQLKVLQPLVGTWQASGTNVDEGYQWDYRITFKWSPSKKVIVRKAEGCRANTNAELAEQEWSVLDHGFLIWNHEAQAIEETVVNDKHGSVVVQSLAPDTKGQIAVSRKSSTLGTPGETSDRVVTITQQQLTVESTNRKDAAGEILSDRTFTMTRVE